MQKIRELASEVMAQAGAGRQESAVRIAAQFFDDFSAAPVDVQEAAVIERPELSDDRWRCFLAGLVEHACLRAGIPAPAWVFEPGQYLRSWWFVTPLQGLHASAFVETPAAFKNHGVFIHRDSIEGIKA